MVTFRYFSCLTVQNSKMIIRKNMIPMRLQQIDETPFAKAFMWYLVILVHHIIRIGQIITNKEQFIFRQQSFGLF